MKALSPDLRRLFAAVGRHLKEGGQRLNSRDFPGAEGDGAQSFTRPRNVRASGVTVWPRAARWLDGGGRIYHWDG